jgi:hypothetical protein
VLASPTLPRWWRAWYPRRRRRRTTAPALRRSYQRTWQWLWVRGINTTRLEGILPTDCATDEVGNATRRYAARPWLRWATQTSRGRPRRCESSTHPHGLTMLPWAPSQRSNRQWTWDSGWRVVVIPGIFTLVLNGGDGRRWCRRRPHEWPELRGAIPPTTHAGLGEETGRDDESEPDRKGPPASASGRSAKRADAILSRWSHV